MKGMGWKEASVRMEEYFASRRQPRTGQDGERLTDKSGAVLYEEKAATVTGLARYLGFGSREEMLAVADKKTKALVLSAFLAEK